MLAFLAEHSVAIVIMCLIAIIVISMLLAKEPDRS